MKLDSFFEENSRVALGFSGGVDSSYLLYEGIMCGADIQPYYIKTVFQPQFELDDARRLARQLGVTLKVLEINILSIPAIAGNPSDRCYHCKRELFGVLQRQALADGYSAIIDGTNASDDAGDRPGMRALRELSVRSPLRECGLTKDDVRQFSKEAGLFTWDKPAYACLATRIPTDEAITAEALARVEKSEDALRRLGFADFRVRVFNGAARLQFSRRQMDKALAEVDSIKKSITQYFPVVLLDLDGR